MRWLLLDEVLEIKKQRTALSRGRIPAAEYSAEILLIEMMAQTGAMILGAENNFAEDVIFAKIERAEFLSELVPGTPVEVRAAAESLRPEGSWIEASVESSSGAVASAKLLLMCVGHLDPGTQEPITFHQAFMNHFQVRSKLK